MDTNKDFFGNSIKEDIKVNSIVREIESAFKGKILSSTEIKLLPKSVRDLK